MNINDHYRKFKDGNTVADNTWMQICCRYERIYIVVRYRSTLADLEWDYTSQLHLEVLNGPTGQIVEQGIDEIYQRYAVNNPRCRSYIGALTGSFRNLNIDDAERIAEELYQLYDNVLYLG